MLPEPPGGGSRSVVRFFYFFFGGPTPSSGRRPSTSRPTVRRGSAAAGPARCPRSRARWCCCWRWLVTRSRRPENPLGERLLVPRAIVARLRFSDLHPSQAPNTLQDIHEKRTRQTAFPEAV